MKEIRTEKKIDENGATYAKAAGCPGKCYQANTEGQVLDICYRYQVDLKQKKECCLDDCEA